MNQRLAELLFAVGGETEEYMESILVELLQARVRHPDWPSDPVHASAIIGEESGELTQAALDFYYRGEGTARMMEECIQVGAMALRFLMHLGEYRQKAKG